MRIPDKADRGQFTGTMYYSFYRRLAGLPSTVAFDGREARFIVSNDPCAMVACGNLGAAFALVQAVHS